MDLSKTAGLKGKQCIHWMKWVHGRQGCGEGGGVWRVGYMAARSKGW